jgi:hypothetical protein
MPKSSIFPDIDEFSRAGKTDRTINWGKLEQEGKLLYTAYLLPEEEDLQRRFNPDISKKIVYRILDGGETWVTAGKPILIPMEDLVNEGNIDPSAEIKAQLRNYRFGYLKLACGFGGHEGTPHPMIQGKMTVTLSCEPNNSEEPLGYGWSPKDTMDGLKVAKEYSITPTFDFVPFKMEAGYKKHIEYTQLEPIITVIGGQTAKMTWHYSPSSIMKREQIEGGREARMIVRLPKNSKKLKVSLDVQATVKENFLQSVFSYSGKHTDGDFEDLKEQDFILSRDIEITYRNLHEKRFESNFADNLLGKPAMTDSDKMQSFDL